MVGSNKHGKLGIGLTYEQCQKISQPVLVSELSNSHIVDISLAKSHSLAVCSKGRVFAWGKITEGFPMCEDFQSSKELIKPKGVYRVHVNKDKESLLNVITGPH